MPSNTKENGFETLIVDTLVNSNGYEQGVTTEYNKQYAIDEDRLFRFLMSTQKKAMDELHILDSDLEKDRFFKQLDKKLKSDGVSKSSVTAPPYTKASFPVSLAPSGKLLSPQFMVSYPASADPPI